MIIRSDAYPRSSDVAKHGGNGEFGVETILTREQLGQAGRLFVRGTGIPGIRRSAISFPAAAWFGRRTAANTRCIRAM